MKITPKSVARIALFAALSILFGKFLAFNIGDWFRLSFENLPILLCGYLFGPISGMFCGIVADLVGCLLRGYAINPIITLGAAMVGMYAGIFGKRGSFRTPRLWLSVSSAHLAGSLILKSFGIYVFYATPPTALVWRVPSYAAVALAEYAALRLLLAHKGFSNLMEK